MEIINFRHVPHGIMHLSHAITFTKPFLRFSDVLGCACDCKHKIYYCFFLLSICGEKYFLHWSFKCTSIYSVGVVKWKGFWKVLQQRFIYSHLVLIQVSYKDVQLKEEIRPKNSNSKYTFQANENAEKDYQNARAVNLFSREKRKKRKSCQNFDSKALFLQRE